MRRRVFFSFISLFFDRNGIFVFSENLYILAKKAIQNRNIIMFCAPANESETENVAKKIVACKTQCMSCIYWICNVQQVVYTQIPAIALSIRFQFGCSHKRFVQAKWPISNRKFQLCFARPRFFFERISIVINTCVRFNSYFPQMNAISFGHLQTLIFNPLGSGHLVCPLHHRRKQFLLNSNGVSWNRVTCNWHAKRS